MPDTIITVPVRRHPDCADDDCPTCLEDHEALADYVRAQMGCAGDWLRLYRLWLDAHDIPAEVNGWASRQAFDAGNIKAFLDERKGE